MELTDQYLGALKALLPQGPMWNAEAGSVLAQVLSGWAVPLAQLHTDTLGLMRELDPANANEWLEVWEHALGLSPSDLSLQQRRDMICGRLALEGNTTLIGMVTWLSLLGYACTITPLMPATCVDPCNAVLWNSEPTTCVSACNVPCVVWPWQWCHEFSMSGVPVQYATCTDVCNVSLCLWESLEFETWARSALPAHCFARFVYPS